MLEIKKKSIKVGSSTADAVYFLINTSREIWKYACFRYILEITFALSDFSKIFKLIFSCYLHPDNRYSWSLNNYWPNPGETFNYFLHWTASGVYKTSRPRNFAANQHCLLYWFLYYVQIEPLPVESASESWSLPLFLGRLVCISVAVSIVFLQFFFLLEI